MEQSFNYGPPTDSVKFEPMEAGSKTMGDIVSKEAGFSDYMTSQLRST